MDNIYLTIRELARQCKNENVTMTRADLAYELTNFGIREDSSEICILVYEAYNKFKDDSIITSFVTNDKTRSLYDAYNVMNSIKTNVKDTLQIISTHTNNGTSSLTNLQKSVNDILNLKNSKNENSFWAIMTGTQGTTNIQNKANIAFEKYTDLINNYETARSDVKASMVDFVFLREHINNLFIKYSLELIDIFGDKIKAINPEMFDFDSVEYLDVKGMLDTIKLEYDTISNSCAYLISSLLDDFHNTLLQSTTSYKAAGNKTMGIALVGLNLIGHYIDAESRNTELKQDLLKFTNKIKKDAATINGDIARLSIISRTINELYIPKADAFFKYAEQVLNPELIKLIDTLYSSPSTYTLKEKRDKIVSELQETEEKLLDAQLNIDIYTASCNNYKQLLDSNRKNYLEAKQSKPAKPSAFANLITFGSSNTKYNRELSEWFEINAPAIRYYEELLTDQKLDSEELNKQKIIHKNESLKIKKLKKEVEKVSIELRQKLSESPEVQKQLIPYLEDIIRLLKIAKDIISSKVDEKFIKAINIKEYTSNELSPSLTNGIASFSDIIRNELHLESDYFVSAPLSKTVIDENGECQTIEVQGTGISEEESTLLAEKANTVISNTTRLLAEVCKLEAMKREAQISEKFYMEQLAALQTDFKQQMDIVTRKGDVLRESLKKINTSTSSDELKKGLLSLSDNQYSLSEKDFEDFLNGTKTIEL